MKTIIRIIKNAADWRWHLVIATIALLLVTGVNLAAPLAVRKLFEVLATTDLNAATRSIIIIGCVLLALYVLRTLFQFLNNYYAHIAAWYMVAKMRGKLYAHFQTLSMGFFSDKQTGNLMSRVIEDTANFEVLIAHALPDLITSILTFAGVLGILLVINPVLAALTCVPLPIIIFCSFFVKRMHKHFTKRQAISAELNSMLQDNFSGMKEIQIFNREEYESRKIESKARQHAAQTMKGIFWISTMHPVMNFLSGLGTFAVVIFGGLLALNGNLALADITVFLLYLGLFYTPVATLSRVLEDIQTSVVSGKRVFEMLDVKSEVKDLPNAKIVSKLSGNIEFKNVSFDYKPRKEKTESELMSFQNEIAVINGINFTAKKGEMIALVGPTGAGKTTITSLLARFYDVNKGSITIDGIDIRDMTLTSLRNQISIVMQDVFLFNGSIAQNIAYGKEGAGFEEIVEAAKTASIHKFIDSLPEKYDTIIGERGVRLSGGQKQRIAIARAVLKDSPILILDEATSAVDNETEKEIQKAINALAGKRTMIVIAHRLSTVEKADEILVLNKGKIVERGTHAELMAKGGAYAAMKI